MNPHDFSQFAWRLTEELSIFNAALQGGGPQRARVEVLPDETLREYPVLPAIDTVVFPRLAAPLFIGRELSRRAIEAAQDEDIPLLVVAQRDPNIENPRATDLFTIGAETTIGRVLRMPDGSQSLFCHGEHRVEIVKIIHERPYLRVLGRRLYEPEAFDPNLEALIRATLAIFEKVVELDENIPEEALVAAMNMDEPGWLADLIVSTLSIPLSKRQPMLEILDPIKRLRSLSVLLAEELDVLELENQIHEQVQQQMDRSQREYFLREQIRAIQDELGEGDEVSRDMAELHERLRASQMPETVRAKGEKELARMNGMPPMTPEIAIIRTYIEWLLDLPWGEPGPDNTDIAHAQQVLDAYHYGLEKAKERVLEHIAVRKLAADAMRTPILCFAGPPGTGKTSMGRSIAEALGRKFVRVSLGGVRDEAEIRGHRRTYIGAMPGRILQTMRNAGVVNPVFMLDEVDKLGYDFRGDPSSALLEVLDPEQNHAFSDHYLDADYDLSHVLFIATANNAYNIPPALLDRMEVIEFPGYADFEKALIAREFLIPRLLREHGLGAIGLHFGEETIHHIIQQYTYEAGVRNLERELANICRKVARRVAEDRKHQHRILPSHVSRYLGPPRYLQSKIEEEDGIGVATSLAWTEAGGDLMPVEVIVMPGKGGLMLTGQLGEVMQESAQAALSYARAHAADYGYGEMDFDKFDIHIHVPEGAIPKDGPSAGITLATALVSVLTNRPIKRQVGMTGEITLRGRVLPVGGLKEKLLTAQRGGLTTVIIPERNQKDLEEVPRHVRRQLDIQLVAHIDQVLALALNAVEPAPPQPPAPRRRASAARKSKQKAET
ncbi:MAG: endopeptidase La [Caldilineales bacterium]|nr:endopeptidase La [Caldilineales bacterium]